MRVMQTNFSPKNVAAVSSAAPPAPVTDEAAAARPRSSHVPAAVCLHHCPPFVPVQPQLSPPSSSSIACPRPVPTYSQCIRIVSNVPGLLPSSAPLAFFNRCSATNLQTLIPYGLRDEWLQALCVVPQHPTISTYLPPSQRPSSSIRPVGSRQHESRVSTLPLTKTQLVSCNNTCSSWCHGRICLAECVVAH